MRPGLHPILFSNRLFLDGRNDVAAAFSLRRLRTSYTGPLVRLRRSSDNAELDFGAGQRWVSYPDVLAWVAGSTPFATTFYEQFNGRNLTQASASAQPQIILAANGRPALLFDGSNDYLQTASGFALNQPWAFNIIYRRVTSVQAAFENVFDGQTDDKGTLFRRVAVPGDNNLYAGVSLVSDDAVSMPIGTRGAVGGLFNNASARVEVNGAAIATFTGTVGTENLDGLTLGGQGGAAPAATRFSNIDVQELALFSTAHTQAQLKADNAAMRAAWGF
jgi:hypothetical protein